MTQAPGRSLRARGRGPGQSARRRARIGHDEPVVVDLDLAGEVRVDGLVAVAPPGLEARVALAVDRDREIGEADVDDPDRLGLPAPEPEAADGRVFVKGVAERSTSVAPARSGRDAPERSVQRPAPSLERSSSTVPADEAHLEAPDPPSGVAEDPVPGGEDSTPGGPRITDSAVMPSGASWRRGARGPRPTRPPANVEGAAHRTATSARLPDHSPEAPRALGSPRPRGSRQASAVRRRASSAFGGAPTTVSTTWPSLKKRSVGMAWTP